jgi:hypothetical protein
MRGAEISFFPQPLLKLLKVGLQSLQMGSVAPMKSPYESSGNRLKKQIYSPCLSNEN